LFYNNNYCYIKGGRKKKLTAENAKSAEKKQE